MNKIFYISKIKSLIKYTFFFFCCFFFFLLVGFYLYYKYEVPDFYLNSKLNEYYPESIILKTGGNLNFPEKRLQWFLNFPVEKPKGVVRIGTFGDSHTFGEEVVKTSTYPYYLQRLFNKRFPHQLVEVLNFGMSGTGFSEQFFLWEKYAKAYQLDYILLGPAGFYPQRDTRFSFYIMNYFLPPHNRFILDENQKLKEVHIPGKTIQERFKNYNSLIPNKQALYYDKQPFKVYEMLLPFLKYKIKNPFYYTKMNENQESVIINKTLLNKIKKTYHKKILFFTNVRWKYDQYRYRNYLREFYNHSLTSKNLYNLNFIPFTQGIYRVFGHESSLGNEVTAQFYFNALLGNTSFFLNIIQCYFQPSELPFSFYKADNKLVERKEQSTLLQKKAFNKADVDSASHLESHNTIDLKLVNQIQVLGKDKLLFNFRANISDHYYREGTYDRYKKKGTKSFFTFLNKRRFIKSMYIPLNFELKEGMSVYIQYKDKQRFELGSVKPLDVYKKFFVVYSKHIRSGLNLDYTHWFIYLKGLKREEKGELFIGNYKLGDVIKGVRYGEKMLKFIPAVKYANTFLMMGPQNLVQEKDFPKKFSVSINYQMENEYNVKSLIPDWTCRKERKEIKLDLPYFESITSLL